MTSRSLQYRYNRFMNANYGRISMALGILVVLLGILGVVHMVMHPEAYKDCMTVVMSNGRVGFICPIHH